MRWKYLIILVLLAAGVPYPGAAQSPIKVMGSVADKETGKPLSGANVIVAGTGFGAVTNEQGNFVLENIPEGEYRLQVSYVGYRTETSGWFTVESDHAAVIDFELTQMPFEAPEVEVVGERILSDIIDATADVEIISEDEIRRGGYQSVGEAVNGLAGIFVQETGGTGSYQTVSIRGSKTNHVMVVVDGVRISKPHGGSADLSLIPLSSVREIAVVKGGNTAQFGADALGGIVYIRTKQFTEKPPCLVNGHAGSFGARSFQGMWGHNKGHWQFLGNYERKMAENSFAYNGPYGSRRKRENADFTMNNAFGKLKYINSRMVVTLSGFINHSNRGMPGFIHNLSGDARSYDVQKIVNLQLNRKITNQWNLEWQSSYNGYNDRDKQESFPPYDTKHNSFSLENGLKLKRQWFTYFTSMFGAAHRIDEGELNFRSLFDVLPGIKVNRISSIYIYNEYSRSFKSLIRSITGVASVRYSYHHHHVGYFSPKFGISTLLAVPLSPKIKANWSRSFHLPDFYDMYYEGYRAMGNPNLRPEHGTDFDAGGSLTIPCSGTAKFDVNYFHKSITDLIHWRRRFDGVFYPFNLSRALIYGSEWKLQWNGPGDIVTINANHTYLRALNKTGERTTHNKILTNRPIHMTTIHGTLSIRRFFLTVKQRFVRKRYIREANSKWIPPYAVTDCVFGAKFSPHGKTLRTRIGIYNLRNEEYRIIERAPMPGREVRLSAEFSF